MVWAMGCAAWLACMARAASDGDWHPFYDGGFSLQPSGAWLGPTTKSEKTPEGLHIADPTTEPGSGRLYYYLWQVKPEEGATVEARVKVTAASDLWGACLNVADGVHEEDVSFFPDRIALSYAKISTLFPVAEGFHTYRVTFRGRDIQVFADEKLLLDGTGQFAAPVIEKDRNRVAFGASASGATSDSVWQLVRFRGGKAEETKPAVIPDIPGLQVERGETIAIIPGASYQSFFQFASGMLQVGDRRSTDGGRTWFDAPGPWCGAFQFPDGEAIQLDYRTHQADAEGWFSSALTRWDAEGKPLPTLRARLHVPDFVPMIDDDGSERDGPWCDHSITRLRDGSLLAACSGTFREDKTPVTSYPAEYGAKKYRGWVCRSADRGLTWEYLSTVTADPNLGSEGCNEMCLVRPPDGSLLCLFRTGGNAQHPSPLYQCRSTDEGRTWGQPERVADRGVWPNVCLTKSGVLVCAYGRPGNWLTFSLDSGKTWVGHFCFYEGPTTSYMVPHEIAPDRVLVVWDRRWFDDGGNEASGEVGTWFTVKRTRS